MSDVSAIPVALGAANPGPLLWVRHLRKHFPFRDGGRWREAAGVIRAVEDVTFDLRPGETLGLVGESGSGKTTTVRCIVRALTPTGGEVWFRAGDRVVGEPHTKACGKCELACAFGHGRYPPCARRAVRLTCST